MILTSLFEQFLQEKRYVHNVSQNTVEFYSLSFKTFNLSALPLSQSDLNAAIVKMRESGKSVAAVNAYVRGMRAFVHWLFENGHLQEKLKLKKLKSEDKQMRTFSDAQIRAILSYKPKTKTEHRLLALLMLLTDTGERINELACYTRVSTFEQTGAAQKAEIENWLHNTVISA